MNYPHVRPMKPTSSNIIKHHLLSRFFETKFVRRKFSPWSWNVLSPWRAKSRSIPMPAMPKFIRFPIDKSQFPMGKSRFSRGKTNFSVVKDVPNAQIRSNPHFRGLKILLKSAFFRPGLISVGSSNRRGSCGTSTGITASCPGNISATWGMAGFFEGFLTWKHGEKLEKKWEARQQKVVNIKKTGDQPTKRWWRGSFHASGVVGSHDCNPLQQCDLLTSGACFVQINGWNDDRLEIVDDHWPSHFLPFYLANWCWLAASNDRQLHFSQYCWPQSARPIQKPGFIIRRNMLQQLCYCRCPHPVLGRIPNDGDSTTNRNPVYLAPALLETGHRRQFTDLPGQGVPNKCPPRSTQFGWLTRFNW